jgi:hypothetical protein
MGTMKQQAWTIRAWASELLRYADDEAVIEKWHGVIDAAERRGVGKGYLRGALGGVGAGFVIAAYLLGLAKC